MMFSCMNALLSRKDTLQLFQIKKKKKTDNVHHVKVCPLCFPPHQTSPKHNPHVYS